MKRNILSAILFVILFAGNQAYAQQLQTIPDANLRTFLQSQFPECFNGNLLDTSCYKVKYLEELNISNLAITDLSGIQFFKRLWSLNCSNNNITTLENVLPDSLVVLDCTHNQLTSLPTLPDSLQTLLCSYNTLTILPDLPASMNVLHCTNNALTQLPDFPDSFSILWADNNEITSLPPLPDSLRYISLIHNELTVFPVVSLTAKKIHYINVSFNQIPAVPELSPSLQFLEVGGNRISGLPSLPSGLLSLGCSKNQITCLPFLPVSLKWLGFKENPITCIPNMPPNLTSFNGTTNIICTAANTLQNNCTYYTPASGTVYVDYNGNNIQDPEDTGLRDILLSASNAAAPQTFTDENGKFTLYLLPGSYIYQANVSDTLFTTPGLRLIKIVDGISNTASYNYALTPVKEIRDVRVTATIIVTPRPGFKTTYTLTCINTGNYPVTNAELRFSYSSLFTFETASQSFDSHKDSVLLWNIPALYPGEKKNISVTLTLPPTVSLGTLLPSITSLKPLNNGDTTRNYYVLTSTVTGSYDPNDKQVFPEGSITPEFISGGKDLEYTIRFQNTGTADAINVVILDTISSKLDITTLTMLSASHPYRYEQRGNKASWTFEGIHLPDMHTNEPASHGFIKFIIKPVPTLALGEIITNNAGIVFDFNEAIITNQTETKIATPPITSNVYSKDESSEKMHIYPNPSADKVAITFHTETFTGNAFLTVRNSLGQKVSSKPVYITQGLNMLELDIHTLSAGMYYIELKYAAECAGSKLLKQ